MRFRFCGDLDCPDWVLAEISILSRMTSVKMKLICNQVMSSLLGASINYEKVDKLTADAKFELGDTKACIACLSFILSSAAKFNVDSEALSNELQQLGLPKEHSTALCKIYADNVSKLQEELSKQSFHLSSLEGMEWRIDYLMSSNNIKEVNEAVVHVKLNIHDPDTKTTQPLVFTFTEDKFRVFHYEMKQAYNEMDALG